MRPCPAWLCPPLLPPRFPPSVELCSFFPTPTPSPRSLPTPLRTFSCQTSLSPACCAISCCRDRFPGTILVISRDCWTCRRIRVPSRICLSSAILGCHRCISTCKCTSWYFYFFWIDFSSPRVECVGFGVLRSLRISSCPIFPALHNRRSFFVFFVLKFLG